MGTISNKLQDTVNVHFTSRESINKSEIDYSKIQWVKSLPDRTGTGRGSVKDLPPRLTVMPSGLYFNRVVVKYLGNSEEVVIGLDAENSLLVFRPVRQTPGKTNVIETARRFSLNKPKNRNYMNLFSAPLARSLRQIIGCDENTEESISFLAEYVPDRDLIVVDLSDPLE